jgi:hypothetical protein
MFCFKCAKINLRLCRDPGIYTKNMYATKFSRFTVLENATSKPCPLGEEEFSQLSHPENLGWARIISSKEIPLIISQMSA